MKFLGVRVGEHDSNITYTDGVNVKYFKPERANQIKHFAYNDIFSWLESSFYLKYNLKDIDAIAFVLDSYQFPWLSDCKTDDLYQLINIPYPIFTELKCPIYKIDHHYAHSLSSWMLTSNSDVDFVIDGYGDFEKSCSVFKNNKLLKHYTLNDIYSLGKFLSYESKQLLNVQGLDMDIAGKVMALQSFGHVNKEFYNYIKQFNFEESKNIYDFKVFCKTVGSDIVVGHKVLDFVTTVHKRMEEIIPDFFTKYIDKHTFTYSGGVAQNICINTNIKKLSNNIVIPPHCADEGLSLGCVEFLRRQYEQPVFDKSNFPFWQTDIKPDTTPSDTLIKQTAKELAKGKIVGWYQGHGEIGPRALGNRSILMSPKIKDGKSILNKKVKHREDYRPFAASIKLDKTKDYFDWEGESEFMLYSVKFRDKIFDSIAHVDETSRIQTVKPNHEYFYRLLDEFEKLTGLPMLLNTSLNNNGRPIAGKPEDVFALLKHSDLDFLVVGDCVYGK